MKEFKRGKIVKESFVNTRRYKFDIMNSTVYESKKDPDCVFVGDGFIERFELAHYFNQYGKMLNRGIDNALVSDVAFTFDDDVVALSPKVCVVMAGTREAVFLDGFAGAELANNPTYNRIFPYIDKEYLPPIIKDYKTIFKKAKKNKIHLVVLSCLPLLHSESVGRDYRNYYIDNINLTLKKLAKKYKADYVDLSFFKGGNGQIKKEFLFDEFYVNGKAYNDIAKALYPVFDKTLKGDK